jgi:hypothetical protein
MRQEPAPNPVKDDARARLLDALIPGTATGWPSASAVLSAAVAADWLDEAARSTFDEWAGRLAGSAPAELAGRIAEFEADEPERFETLLRGVYGAYYTRPAVLAVVAALADAGPREPSRLFDPDLLPVQPRTSTKGSP